jgi:hypothetical protein
MSAFAVLSQFPGEVMALIGSGRGTRQAAAASENSSAPGEA